MIRSLALVFALVLGSVVPSMAQLAAPGEAGVAMGHMHLTAKNIETTRAFFTTLGGTPVQNGTLQLIRFPGVFVMLRQGEPTAGSVGSVVNHFGFNVKDIKTSIAAWQAAGLMVETTARADQAYLTSPDGARIEILEDKMIAEPIRMHHIHWNIVAVPEVQAWYAKNFGAKPGMRGANQAADLPGVNLTFGKVDVVNAGTKGRAIDHVGFEVRNLPQFIAKLEAAGIKTEAPTRKAGNGTTSVAFLTDPWGTYIELTEGLAP
jgi:catechol-2,3-dioxygenase